MHKKHTQLQYLGYSVSLYPDLEGTKHEKKLLRFHYEIAFYIKKS